MNRYELGATARFIASFRDLDGNLINPTTVTAKVTRPDGTVDTISTISNPSTGNFNCDYVTVAEGEQTYTFTGSTPAIPFTEVLSSFFYVVAYDAADIDTLIPFLRFYLGDYTPSYRYTTTTLRSALIFAVKALMRRWRSKYKIDADGVVIRNPNYEFEFAAPPTIQYYDEPAIIIQAAILVKSGAMQEASWQVAAWKDDEISVSNIQADKSRQTNIQQDIKTLDDYFKRRLYVASRQSMVGFNYPPNWREG